jgi:hypothetical protein
MFFGIQAFNTQKPVPAQVTAAGGGCPKSPLVSAAGCQVPPYRVLVAG